MAYTIERREIKGIPVVEVGGMADLCASPHLKDMLIDLIENGHGIIIVDFINCEFADASTLGALVGGMNRVLKLGGSIVIVYDSDSRISRIFDITGLDRVFDIHPSVQSATERFAGGTTTS